MTVDIDHLEELAKKATPGPWSHTPGIFKHYVSSDNGDLGFSLQELHWTDAHEWPAEATAAFIAAANPISVLNLITRLRKAESELGRPSFDDRQSQSADAISSRPVLGGRP